MEYNYKKKAYQCTVKIMRGQEFKFIVDREYTISQDYQTNRVFFFSLYIIRIVREM